MIPLVNHIGTTAVSVSLSSVRPFLCSKTIFENLLTFSRFGSSFFDTLFGGNVLAFSSFRDVILSFRTPSQMLTNRLWREFKLLASVYPTMAQTAKRARKGVSRSIMKLSLISR